MFAADEELALQFLAAAGCEGHAEVGQPLGPGPRNPELFGAVFGRYPGQGVPGDAGPRPAEECAGGEGLAGQGRRAGCGRAGDAALEPGLRHGVPAPVRKQADAVSAGGGGVEISQNRFPGKGFEDVLPHRESGFDVQRHFGDDAQGAKPDDGAVKVGRAAAVEAVDGSVRCHDFQCGD
ncbi:hypothetical protein D9M72_356270 [compost metagenome]